STATRARAARDARDPRFAPVAPRPIAVGAGVRNSSKYRTGIPRRSAPRLLGARPRGSVRNLGSRSWCPEPEIRHQIRGRLDDAGCVAPPRNSANYSSSSRLASAADPPPTLATDFGSGTLAVGRVLDHLLEGGPVDPRDVRHPHHADRREDDVVVGRIALAGALVRARAGPRRRVRRPVRRRERIDGALQGALDRGLAGALAAVAALPGAPAVDLRVAVRDGGVHRLPERPLQVALPAAVVGRPERAGRVV